MTALEPDTPGYVVEHDERRGCPFILNTRTNSLCAIHSVALGTGRAVERVKPAACRHWPVTLEPDADGRTAARLIAGRFSFRKSPS